MTMRIALFASVFVVTACGTGEGGGGGAGGVSGSGGGAGNGSGGGGGVAGAAGPADCAHIDYASYATAPAVSLRNDVLPIFGFQCTQSSCHQPGAHKAELSLGYRCVPDMTSKWHCTFPATPTFMAGSTTEIDVTQPQPLDAATATMVRANLLAPAKTVNGGGTPRVVPMHPEKSFLVQKLADTQAMQGHSCTNQDPRSSPNAPGSDMPAPCGSFMPLNGELFCQGSYRARFDAIAAWITQGALDN
jgi:hypothetical protein